MSTTIAQPLIRASFYSRLKDKEITNIAIPSVLTFNTDMRLGAGTFDFQIELARDDSADLTSHDFIEFYFPFAGGKEGKHQVGVGYLEDFVSETSSTNVSLRCSGRDLLGHLASIPFQKQIIQTMTLSNLVLAACDSDSYLRQYCKIRGRNPVVDAGAFTGILQIFTINTQKRGAILAEKAELTLNLIYANRLGQAVIYGRSSRDTQIMGRLYKARNGSNVDDITVRRNFSKVMSQCTVEFSGEENLATNKLTSRTFVNTDPRAKIIFQPEFIQFSNTDLAGFAGTLDAGSRIAMLGKSSVRKSNQNLNQVIVRQSYPYFIDDKTQEQIPYITGQNWHVFSEDEDIDAPMKLVGINYNQTAQNLKVQLAFVEPDTLV